MDRLPQFLRRQRNLLVRRGRSREDAEDLIQEAFLRMQEYCGRGGQVHQAEGFSCARSGSSGRRSSRRRSILIPRVRAGP